MLVNVEGVGNVEFPDNTSQEDIQRIVKEQIYPMAGVQPPDSGGFFPALKSGVDTLQQGLYSSLEGVGSLTGLKSLEQYGKEGAARNKQEALDELGQRMGFFDAKDAADYWKWFKENVGSSLPVSGPMLAGGALGSFIPGVGTLAGLGIGALAGAAAGTPIYYGLNRERQKEEQGKVTSEGMALAMAPLQGALDGLLGRVLPEGFSTNLAMNIIAKIGVGAATEAPTEIAQQALERYQAGKPLDSEDAYKEYAEAGIAGGVVGGAFGAAGGFFGRHHADVATPERPVVVPVKTVRPTEHPKEELTALPPPEAFRSTDVNNEQFAIHDTQRRLNEAVDRSVVQSEEPVEPSETSKLLAAARETLTPLGTWNITDLPDSLAKRVVERSAGRGQYTQDKFSLGELQDLGATPTEVEALVSERKPMTSDQAPGIKEIENLAASKNIITAGEGQRFDENFKEFSRQTVGSTNIARLSPPQRAALYETIQKLPEFDQKTKIPWIETPSYAVEQYRKAEEYAINSGKLSIGDIIRVTKQHDAETNRTYTLTPNIAKQIQGDLVKNGILEQVGESKQFRLRKIQRDPRDIVPPPVETPESIQLHPEEDISKREYNVEKTAVKGAEPQYAVVARGYNPDLSLLAKEPIAAFPTQEEANAALAAVQTQPTDAGPSQLREVARGAAAATQTPAPVGPRSPLPNDQRQRILNTVLPALQEQAEQRGLPGIQTPVKLVNSIKDYLGPEGEGVEGVTAPVPHGDAVRRTVLLAWDAIPDTATTDDQIIGHLSGVLDHETVHALIESGAISDQQWKTLYQYAYKAKPKGSKKTYFELAKDNYEGLAENETRQKKLNGKEKENYKNQYIGEEAIANAFRDYAADPNSVTKPVQGIFQAVVNALKRLVASFRGAKIQSPEEIFGEMARGETAQQADTGLGPVPPRTRFSTTKDGYESRTPDEDRKVHAAVARAIQSPEFQEWFGDSVMVDQDGLPLVHYHATSAIFHYFDEMKSNGSIFFSPKTWFMDDYANKITYFPDEIINHLPEIRANYPKDIVNKVDNILSTYDDLHDLGNGVMGTMRNEKAEEIAKLLHAPQIIPAFIKAERPFDYANDDHVEEVLKSIRDFEKTPEFKEMRRNGVHQWKDYFSDNDVYDLKTGFWKAVEDPRVQRAIREDNNFDGFFTSEYDTRNIAVFESNQVKSIFNSGTWNPDDPRIRYSRKVRKAKEGYPERDPRFRGAAEGLTRFAVTLQRPGKKSIVRFLYASSANDARQKVWRSPSLMKGASDILSVDIAARPGRYSLSNPPGFRTPEVDAAVSREYQGDLIRHRTGGLINKILHSDRQFEVPVLGKKLPSMVDARIALQDKMLPVGMLRDNILERGGTITDESDTYMIEQLSQGKTVNEIRDREKGLYLPLLHALRDTSNVTREDLEDYLYARHAPSRNAYLRNKLPPKLLAETPDPSGMSDAQAAQIIGDFRKEGKLKDLDRLAAMVDNIITDTNKVRLDNELIDQNMLAQGWQHYVPLRGLPDEQVDLGEGDSLQIAREANRQLFPRTGKRGGIRGKEDRSATGRKSQAQDILGHILIQNEEAVIRANRNQVVKSFAQMVRDNADMLGETAKILDSYPMTRVRNRKSGMIQLMPDPRAIQEPNTVAFKELGDDGQVHETRIQTKDTRLAQALSGMAAPDAGGALVRTLATMNRFLAHVNTSWNPEFLVSNLAKDTQTAAIVASQYNIKGLSGDIVKSIPGAMRGIEMVLREGKIKSPFAEDNQFAKDFHELQKLGGSTEFLGIKDLNTVLRNIAKEAGEINDNKPLGMMKRGFGKMLDAVEDYNKVAENALRLSAYSALKSRGISPKQAAFVAKNLTVNFNKGGTYKALANSMYLFYNASLQGSWVMLNALRTKRVQKIVGGIAASGFVFDTLNALMSDDADKDGKKDYDEIDDWVKENNIILTDPTKYVGREISNKDGSIANGTYLKIPMPYGFNAFFNFGRALSAYMRGAISGSDTASSITLSFFNAFNPIGGSNSFVNLVSPTILDPVVDIARNKDFAERPIVPDRIKSGIQPVEPLSQRYWSNTNPAYVGIADWLNRVSGGDMIRPGSIDISPNHIDYMMNYILGGGGAFVLRTFYNTPENIWSALQGDWSNIDLNGVIMARKLVGNTGNIQDRRQFYKNGEDVLLADKEYKAFLQAGDYQKARQIMSDYGPQLRIAPFIKSIDSNLSRLRKQLKDVRGNPYISETLRGKLEKQIQDQEDMYIDQANRMYNRYVGTSH